MNKSIQKKISSLSNATFFSVGTAKDAFDFHSKNTKMLQTLRKEDFTAKRMESEITKKEERSMYSFKLIAWSFNTYVLILESSKSLSTDR